MTEILEAEHKEHLDMTGAVKLAIKAFQTIEAKEDEAERYEIAADRIEVALLDEARNRRKFRRLRSNELSEILST